VIDLTDPLVFACSGVYRDTDRRCQWDAESLALFGCVHEHITPVFLCAGHGELSLEDLGAACRPCTFVGHHCPLAEIVGDVDDLDYRLIEGFIAANPDMGDPEEQRAWWQANLHRVPDNLRRLRHASAEGAAT
jgi:hypothetical protein